MTAPSFSRRRVLTAAGVSVTALALRPAASAQPADFGRIVRMQPGTAPLRGEDRPPTAIWGFDDTMPGPLLRVRRGGEVRLRLVNALPEPTTVHWHGMRLPNALDGVPHLTQPPIAPGAAFDVRFTALDAGTFWYHAFAAEQTARGLHGMLIVDEPEPVEVDHDIVLMLADWRLGDRALAVPGPAGEAGRAPDPLLTVNGRPGLDIPVKTNDRLRLRLVNASTGRALPVRIEADSLTVVAIDGQPAEPFAPRDGRLMLGPGNRIDLLMDATLPPGSRAAITVGDASLARFVYAAGPGRAARRADPRPLPDNSLPVRMDFRGALRAEFPLDGTPAAGAGAGRQNRKPAAEPPRITSLAELTAPGRQGTPLFSAKRGRTVMLAIANRTALLQVVHLHGHHFRLLDALDDGWKPFWLDTLPVEPGRIARIAFVADNPGRWLLQARPLDHPGVGSGAWFEVG
jgi:FtsP/CotA-like multicopper oxidase with cupredoxin domain